MLTAAEKSLLLDCAIFGVYAQAIPQYLITAVANEPTYPLPTTHQRDAETAPAEAALPPTLHLPDERLSAIVPGHTFGVVLAVQARFLPGEVSAENESRPGHPVDLYIQRVTHTIAANVSEQEAALCGLPNPAGVLAALRQTHPETHAFSPITILHLATTPIARRP